MKSSYHYFSNCSTIIEAKALYRKLMMENHPDRGGSPEITIAVKKEFDDFILHVNDENNQFNTQYYRNPHSARWTSHLHFVMDPMLNYEVEIIGDWIWVFGVPPLDSVQMYMNDFEWSKKHNGWYYTEDSKYKQDPLPPSQRRVRTQKDYTTDDLRSMWGSEVKKSKRYLK